MTVRAPIPSQGDTAMEADGIRGNPKAAGGHGRKPDRHPRNPTLSLAAQAAGTIIGLYQLLQLIGEGGMGEVWLAEQKQPVRRRVAVKLIKAGMDTREVIARFESERQALALMNHPVDRQSLRRRLNRRGPPLFRDGICGRYANHRLLRSAQAQYPAAARASYGGMRGSPTCSPESHHPP